MKWMTGAGAGALLLTAVCTAAAQPALSAPNGADQSALELFERRIRPLFARECNACHNAREAKAGLRLDTADGFRKGGESGPLIDPAAPEKSLLLAAVSYTRERLKMPPRGRLQTLELADLAAWVRAGAPWPGAQPASRPEPAPGGPLFTAEERGFWAFQPVRRPPVPRVAGAAVPHPIDAFLLQRLAARNLQPAPPADRRTLIRRVTLNLTGLPPTPEEIDAFLADTGPRAWEKVIERLLASPAYGERWARHWLDVARYADSNGLDENTAFANAWRYRDYVVRALNADRRYDEFVREQIAGDLLPPSPDPRANADRLTATAFLSLGPKVLAEPDKEKMVMDIVDEQIDTMGKAFLGLTLGCARCHDHKFDPIPTRDYYGLAGIFKSTRTMATLATVARVLERPLPGPPPDPSTGGKPAPAAATCIAVEEEKQPGEVRVHLRGNHLTLGEPAPRIFPRILAGEHQVPVPPGRSGRLELAEWLTRRENPLTARVIVNRVWQHHFGEGLVRTPDNFGKLGDRPSHPELLDWLADRFTAPASEPHGCGWSLKRLHRLILTTQAYRMSTAYDARAARADPDNRLLWRFHRRRLEVEAIRDGILAVSGTLDRTMGGSLLTTPNFGYVTNDQSANAARYDSPRRSLYLPVIRNAVYDVFQVFDFVEPSIENGKRSSTTVAPQALFLLNGSFMLAQSRALAERMLREAGDDPARLERAFRLAYGRPPSAPERAELLGYLREYAARLSSSESDPARRRLLAWQSVAQILFASSEFVYVE